MTIWNRNKLTESKPIIEKAYPHSFIKMWRPQKLSLKFTKEIAGKALSKTLHLSFKLNCCFTYSETIVYLLFKKKCCINCWLCRFFSNWYIPIFQSVTINTTKCGIHSKTLNWIFKFGNWKVNFRDKRSTSVSSVNIWSFCYPIYRKYTKINDI